jgi:multiple sugar transport system substrate-binding protein
MFLEVRKGNGGFWIENGEVGLDKPEALQAVKFLRTTIEQKISPGFATFSSEQEYSDTLLNHSF